MFILNQPIFTLMTDSKIIQSSNILPSQKSHPATQIPSESPERISCFLRNSIQKRDFSKIPKPPSTPAWFVLIRHLSRPYTSVLNPWLITTLKHSAPKIFSRPQFPLFRSQNLYKVSLQSFREETLNFRRFG